MTPERQKQRERIIETDRKMRFDGNLVWVFDNAEKILNDRDPKALQILSTYSLVQTAPNDPGAWGILRGAIEEYRVSKG